MLDDEAVPSADAGGLELIANSRKLPLLLLELGAQGPDSLRYGLRARVERPGHLRQQVAISGDELVGGLADDHVDAAQPRADAGLGYDDRRPDVRGVPDVGAAAQLARPVAEAHDPDDIPVLLLEQVHRALRDGILVRLLALVKRKRFPHLLHHASVDPMQLFFADGSVQRNVKRRVVGPDPRPLLNDPFAQGFAQRLVQQMSRRVVAHDLPPPLVIDRRGRLLPHTHLAGDHSPEVRERTL